MLGQLGLVLETLGIVIILGSQIAFWYRVRKKWRSLERAFIALTIPREGWEYGAVLVMPQSELKKLLKGFPLPAFLYDNFKYTVIGLAISLSGVLLQFGC